MAVAGGIRALFAAPFFVRELLLWRRTLLARGGIGREPVDTDSTPVGRNLGIFAQFVFSPRRETLTRVKVIVDSGGSGPSPKPPYDGGHYPARLRPSRPAPLTSKPAAGNPSGLVSNGSARAAPPSWNTATWHPRDTPKMSAEDIIVVLTPRETLHLKTVFQTGDLDAAIAQYVGDEAGTTLKVWPVWTQNLIVCGTQHVEAATKLARDFNLNVGSGSVPLRGHVKLNGGVQRQQLKGKVAWREGELAFVRKLGTSYVVVLTFVGRRQQGAPRNKTSKPTDNGGASSGKSGKATGRATGNKTARENSPGNKTSSSKENKNRKTSGRSAKPPAFQEGDFPPLGNSKTAITSKVNNWAEIASTPSFSPSPL
ncbi:hypothetical protein HPB49_005896 [Dermacentor silvarum]|uniref:Uncharacterized protein n=1 Tax=Dermacentor silvarum TaxID=543639 RepID=A0ACB8C7M4_DERSI|nr:hypothetical protein HPB49_005896 [Dermacentor silvarum]